MTPRPTKKPKNFQSGQAAAAMVAANARAYEGVGLAAVKGIKKAEGSRPIYLSDGPDGAICIQFAEEAVISLSTEEAKLLAARLMRKLKP